MELRRKALELIVDLVTTRTVDDLIGFLRKELIKASTSTAASSTTATTENGNGGAASKKNISDEDTYRHSLVRAIRDICMKFPACIPAILPALCDVSNLLYVGDGS